MPKMTRLQREKNATPVNNNPQASQEQAELTIWETMFSTQHQRQQNDGLESIATGEDAIESHRKKKEAIYEKRGHPYWKQPDQPSIDSRGDNTDNGDRKKKHGLLARIRRRNDSSREEPEAGVPAVTSFEFDALSKSASTENWEETVASSTLFKREDSVQRSATYRQFGGDPLQSIRVEETTRIPIPTHPEHVVVKITASTVTVHDCLLRRGLDFNVTEPASLPAISGRDFVGYVLLCGGKATNFKPGDRVAGLMRSGGNARYAEIHHNSLVSVPTSLDAAEAACMVSVHTSAYQAINLATKDTSVYELEGKKVLVVGGMDGVGQAIIQMCRKAKATVFATAPDRRHAYVRSILSATPLPENPEEWADVAKDSMDVVFDGISDGQLDASFLALNETGKLVSFGHSSLLRDQMGWFGVPFERRLQRYQLERKPNAQVHDLWDCFRQDPELYKKNLTALFQLLKMRKIRPQIAKRVSLDEIGLSHRKLEQGQVRGTVVCLPWKRVPRRNIVQVDENGDVVADN